MYIQFDVVYKVNFTGLKLVHKRRGILIILAMLTDITIVGGFNWKINNIQELGSLASVRSTLMAEKINVLMCKRNKFFRKLRSFDISV